MMNSRLLPLMRPQSIALVGASAGAGSLGAAVLENLEKAGFAGDLYLVNPRRAEINGRSCLSSISDLREGIDCAVLAIPGAAVVEAAWECATRRVRSIIVFSAGFAESGEQGSAAQRDLTRIAEEHGIVIEGPNCLGLVNFIDRVPLTFVSTPCRNGCDGPGVAIISQSGALAAVLTVNMRSHRIPLTYSVSTGNEATSGVEDFAEYLLHEPYTRILALVVEQFRNPRRFLQLALRARATNRFLVLLHPGSSSAARASAVTHTGAMAGDYEIMRTLVAHHGVIHVETLEELVDVSQMLIRCPMLPEKGAAVLTESGAFKALALDLCERAGLMLPELAESTAGALRDVLPPFIPASNPLDLTAQALVDQTLYSRTLAPILEDEQFGSVMLGIILTDEGTTAIKLPAILQAIRALRPRKPVVFAALDEGAPFLAQEIDELRELGVACFPSPERALRALAHVTLAGSWRASVETSHSDLPIFKSPGPGTLPEFRSREILESIGIPFPTGELATTVDEAIRIARSVGFPVVLKAQSAELPHKSDAGGVILGVQSEEELLSAWEKLHHNLAVHRPDLVLDGVLVQRMIPSAVEMIVGARNDPDWGPMVLAGFGGVLAEAVHDVILLPPHLSLDEVEKRLLKLKGSEVLSGFRGSPPVDIPAVAKIIVALGELVGACPDIREIDINPVAVFPRGRGAIALDALLHFGA